MATVLIVTLSVHIAQTKGKEGPMRGETRYWIVSSVTLLLRISVSNLPLPLTKRETKKLEASSTPSKDNASLVDPATVSVIGAVNEHGTLQSPSDSEHLDKNPKKDKPTTSKAKSASDKSVKSGSKSATDTKITELNQKWSDRFNCLEALLIARTLEPRFSSTVKVMLTHSPQAGAVKVN